MLAVREREPALHFTDADAQFSDQHHRFRPTAAMLSSLPLTPLPLSLSSARLPRRGLGSAVSEDRSTWSDKERRVSSVSTLSWATRQSAVSTALSDGSSLDDDIGRSSRAEAVHPKARSLSDVSEESTVVEVGDRPNANVPSTAITEVDFLTGDGIETTVFSSSRASLEVAASSSVPPWNTCAQSGTSVSSEAESAPPLPLRIIAHRKRSVSASRSSVDMVRLGLATGLTGWVQHEQETDAVSQAQRYLFRDYMNERYNPSKLSSFDKELRRDYNRCVVVHSARKPHSDPPNKVGATALSPTALSPVPASPAPAPTSPTCSSVGPTTSAPGAAIAGVPLAGVQPRTSTSTGATSSSTSIVNPTSGFSLGAVGSMLRSFASGGKEGREREVSTLGPAAKRESEKLRPPVRDLIVHHLSVAVNEPEDSEDDDAIAPGFVHPVFREGMSKICVCMVCLHVQFCAPYQFGGG